MKLDKKTVLDLIERKVDRVFVYFYGAGCSGTKVSIKEDFDITNDLQKLNLSSSPFEVYVEKKDFEKFDGAIITKTVVADHTGKEKIRYIFSNDKVLDRCGCGTSFSFEKKIPKIDLEKLKLLREKFKK